MELSELYQAIKSDLRDLNNRSKVNIKLLWS